jgi:hypothetical protein
MEDGARKRPLFVVPSLAEAKRRVQEATAAGPTAFELHKQQQQQRQQQLPPQLPPPPSHYVHLPAPPQPASLRDAFPGLARAALAEAARAAAAVAAATPAPPPREANPRVQAAGVVPTGAPRPGPPQPWAGSTSTSTSTSTSSSSSSSSSSGGAPRVLVNRARQARNPVVGLIRACAVELVDELIPDFQLGVGCGCLFVQVKYHLLHPEYLTRRLRELNGHGGPRLKLVRARAHTHLQNPKNLLPLNS